MTAWTLLAYVLVGAAVFEPAPAPRSATIGTGGPSRTISPDGRPVWQYRIVITDQRIELAAGIEYKVWAFNGQVPGPTLIARENEWVRITLINETSVEHSLHSHGLHVPHRMDGVPAQHGHPGSGHPAVSGPAARRTVAPGESFTYEYIARPAGTHFYHCHVNTNEHLDRGMSGALIVLPAEPEPNADYDFALLIDEWDSRYGLDGTPGNPREIDQYDVFTINGRAFPDTEQLGVRLGSVVRYRIINVGSVAHSIHLHGHTFLVTHKDGAPLREPLQMDTVAVAPGERVDFLQVANNPGTWPLHCHTPMHQTTRGMYPGGMMLHVIVGDDAEPLSGAGPVGPGLERIAEVWRASARRRVP